MPVETEVVEAAPVLEAVVLPSVEDAEEQQPILAAPIAEEDIDDSIGNRIIDEPKAPVRRRTARAGTATRKKPAPRKTRKRSPEGGS
jgi:hypothetical protein